MENILQKKRKIKYIEYIESSTNIFIFKAILKQICT